MKNEKENYDITDIVVEKAAKILLIVCRIKDVKCDLISFSFRRFERKFIQRWKELMYKDFPYNYRSKLENCTDLSPATLSRLFKN